MAVCRGTVHAVASSLRSIARAQAGVFSRVQARRCGVADGDISRRKFDGEWLEVQAGVLTFAGTPLSDRLYAWAAVLAVGPPVALGGLWAARFLGLDRAPEVEVERPHLVIPIARRCERLWNVDLERSRLPLVIRHVDRLPVLSPERALRQLAATQPLSRVRDMAHHGIRRRTMTLTGMTAELGRGRHGAARLRQVLEEVAPGYQVVWEGRLHAALMARGLDLTPQLSVNVASGIRYLDLGNGLLRFGVEVDGLIAHLDRFAADRRRDRELQQAGWLIIHVAVSELAEDIAAVADEIAAAYRRRRAELCTSNRAG